MSGSVKPDVTVTASSLSCPRLGCLDSACVHTSLLCGIHHLCISVHQTPFSEPAIPSCGLLLPSVDLPALDGKLPCGPWLSLFLQICAESKLGLLRWWHGVFHWLGTEMSCAVARVCSGCVGYSVLELSSGFMGESMLRYFSRWKCICSPFHVPAPQLWEPSLGCVRFCCPT